MREKKKFLQKRELCTQGKVPIMNFSEEKFSAEESVDIMDSWE